MRLELLDVVGRAHERQRDVVRPQFGRECEIGDILLGDRGKLRTGVRHVDALAGGECPRGQHPGEDFAGRDTFDGQARHAVADHDLRPLGRQGGEVREVDAHAIRRVGAIAATEDDLVACAQLARLRLG